MQGAHSTDQALETAERHIPAIALSRGIGIGRIAFLDGEREQYVRIDLEPGQADKEILRFKTAVAASIQEIAELAADGDTEEHRSVSGIFGVHLLILKESSFVENIETVIREQNVNAEWAIKIVSNRYLKRQDAIADERFREKYLDIADVAARLHTSLNGSQPISQSTAADAVIAVRELRPSTIIEIAKSRPAAVITERGGWTSHASILAREFALPMVAGVHDLERLFSHDDLVIVDGISGQVIIHPSTDTIDKFRSAGVNTAANGREPKERHNRTTTRDGTEIIIRANVDLPDPYITGRLLGAQGIGLYRSESLITKPGVIPTEEQQVAAYKQIADVAGDSGVRIRTFDIGPEIIDYSGISSERNPSLGLRAIRLSLSNPGYFQTQIRAILRAAAGRKIDIVLPMISGVSEIVRSRKIIDTESNRLQNDGIPMGDPKIGAMIEVPSAVFTANEIAKNVDFLCLGTNDLVQYLLAVDRDNDAVADWYQTLHPAVIRAIRDVISEAENAGIPIAVCGEMAGSQFYVPLLIGLGARELSVYTNVVDQIRRLTSGITIQETVGLVNSISKLKTAEQIEKALREHYLQHWSSLFTPGFLASEQ